MPATGRFCITVVTGDQRGAGAARTIWSPVTAPPNRSLMQRTDDSSPKQPGRLRGSTLQGDRDADRDRWHYPLRHRVIHEEPDLRSSH